MECQREVQGEKTEQAPCYRRSYHTACIQRKSVCKNCTETWRPLACCVCWRPITFNNLHPLMDYPTLVENRTYCCTADVSANCLIKLQKKPCFSCGIPLSDSGSPPIIKTTMQFVSVVMARRKNEMARRRHFVCRLEHQPFLDFKTFGSVL